MIERIENALQIGTLVVCAAIALYRIVKRRGEAWTLLSFFYGSWLLGDVYWLACLVFYDGTPQISAVSDLSWYASYIFLYLLLRHTAPPEKPFGAKILPWLGPVFTAGMGVFFMLRGEIAANLVYAGLMGFLLYAAIRRLMERRSVYLSVLILVFCLLEYALWTASCFWNDEIVLHPYYWFDFLLTVSFPFFLPATERDQPAQNGEAAA